MVNFLLVLLSSFLSFATFAQNPGLSIIKVHSDNYCLGTELSIDVDVKGTFPPGNKFTIVAYRNWNDAAARWEYPAELRGDKLVTVLKEPSLANSQSFYLKILTSNPQTETEAYYSMRALTKASVQLTTRWGFTADTINATDAVALALIASPSSPGKVTLNTGETFDLQYATEWPAPYPSNITLPKTKAGSYSIREASNACGTIETGGQVNIKLNPVNFMPVAISPAQPCGGGEVKLIFDVDRNAFDSNTRFKIRFASDNVHLDSYRYIDAPATLTGRNELTARVPENLAEVLRDPVYLGIVTENPSAVSITKALRIYVYPKPSFTLKAETTSINLGESTNISASPTGMPPYKITLTSGEVMDYWMSVTPDKTTSYQVKTFESGCGTIQNPSNAPLTIKVKPSILVNGSARSDRQGIFCEGQTVRLGFRAVGVSAQTTYSVEATTYSDKKISFPAKVVGDSLEFFILKNTSSDIDLDYGNISGIRIVSANPALTSPYTGFKIQSPPAMVLADYSQRSVQFPSPIRLDFRLLGGGPQTAEFMNGVREIYAYNNPWFEQFVKRDTTFRLAKLSNSCFTESNPPSFPVEVVNPAGTTPSMFLKMVKKPACVNDSVEVEISFAGQYEAGNQFTLAYLRDGHFDSYAIQNVTKPGIYKVKFPVWEYGGYLASLQLSSTLPRIVSETERLTLALPPRMPALSPASSKENPIKMYLGASPRVVIEASAYSKVVYSMDGVESTLMADHNGQNFFNLKLQHAKTSEFKLKSVTNTCGTWSGEVTSYFAGIGYKINVNPAIHPNRFCVGSQAEVSFSFESGKAQPGTKFTLQISPSGDAGSYTDIASTTEGQIIRFVTPDLPAGKYYTRIYSSDNIYSEANTLLSIGRAPTAKLAINQLPDASNISVDYGTPVSLMANLTGNPPWGIIYSDGEQQLVTESDGYGRHSPVITSPQTFSITKVWNSCGFGTASGTVNVTVKPF